MQFGVFTYGYSINIGDEIQTIAAAQFLPRIDILIERDRLHWYRTAPETFVIFNGWFTHQPNWPPPNSIRPLFISFYANQPELLVDKKFANYFKRYEPIGCRSLATLDAFQRIGVNAYFSGCLTLTLERSDRPRSDRIYAVDVDEEMYSQMVPRHVREKATILYHEVPGIYTESLRFGIRSVNKVDQDGHYFSYFRNRLYKIRHEARLRLAKQMLERYSEAKLVITSRLHCAMPCLALGTPVILLRRAVDLDPRYAGLRELVRCYIDTTKPIKFDWDNPEPNSNEYINYANELKQRCKDAVQQAISS